MCRYKNIKTFLMSFTMKMIIFCGKIKMCYNESSYMHFGYKLLHMKRGYNYDRWKSSRFQYQFGSSYSPKENSKNKIPILIWGSLIMI